MKKNKKEICPVRRCARPIEYSNGNSRVVLCLHGFTGYPGEMAYPALRLRDSGWDVRVPRLSGHGTCGADFSKTGVSDWRRQISDEWKNLVSRYEEVCVLGHSMGGLLALDLAIEYPVGKIALMAPLLGIRKPGMIFFKPLSLLIEKRSYPWKTNPSFKFFDDRDDDDDAYLGSEYWSWIWMRPLADLIHLQNVTERKLSKISGTVLALFGEKDSVIGKSGRKILESELKTESKVMELSGCGHYIPYEPNPGSRETAMDEVISWFGG
ncbi:MAG: hypothetical protein DRP70_05630 [Spirochaetes bacterium]|nr:MAG: hypothetical protein DRP70_05630 [Spirochaetota bacterium]RKX90239.1 MAG: hypothetical protein DRZ90_16520 [Spirochaetota bacterium]